MVTSPEEFRQQLLDIQNSVDVVYTTLPSDEPRFIIDTNSRTITIPVEFQFLGVKNDHNAETVYFEIDRYFDNEDLSQHTCVIQFANKNNSNDGGVYPVTTMDTTSVDGKIIFGWEIKSDATSLVGDIYFSVRFYSINTTDYVFTYNFNTLTAKSSILDTHNVDNQMIIENYPSELDAWMGKMDELSRGTEGKVEEIEAKGQEVLTEINSVKDSIPEDYNTLSSDVDELKSDLDNVENDLYTIKNLENNGGNEIVSGVQVAGYFTERTFVHSIKPLFSSDSGTFKWGIFKFDKNVSDPSARGNVDLSNTENIGNEIIFDRWFEPNEAIAIVSDSPAKAYGGTKLTDCEYKKCIFTEFRTDDNIVSYISDYFNNEYGITAIFGVRTVEKNVSNVSVMGGNQTDISIGINKAINNKSRHLILIGEFTLSEPISLPSDFILELNNATVTLANNANCNIIRSANISDLSLAKNITIKAHNSILKGNYANQTFDDNGYTRIGVLFYNVDGFDVSGFTIENTHGWAMSFESGCKNGKIHDIHITQDGGHVNQDGIDIRGGCNDIEIYNITGIADDDCIACTAMVGNVCQVVNDGRNGKDIYNIHIHDITMESRYCSIIDLIAHDGAKTHDIRLENIFDTSAKDKVIRDDGKWNSTITIGNYDFVSYAISGNPSTKNDLYNIFISNIVCSSFNSIRFGWSCKNIVIKDIHTLYNTKNMFRFWCYRNENFDAENITICGGEYPLIGDGYVFNNTNGNISKLTLSKIKVDECFRFFQNDSTITNSFILDCDIFYAYNLIVNNTSAPLFDRFNIMPNGYDTLYNADKIGSAIIGEFMPYKTN